MDQANADGAGDLGGAAVRRGRVVAVGIAAAAVPAAVAGCEGEPSHPTDASVRAVQVRVVSGSARGEVGAGFAVGRGRVVTAAHVAESGGQVLVRRRGRWLAARLVRTDPRSDLALLTAPAVGRAAPMPAITTHAEPGAELRLIVTGRPPVRATVRRAITARVGGTPGRRRYRRSALEVECRAASGDSGAALVTTKGAVAGVLFARSRRRPDTAYAVDGRELRSFLRSG